VFFQILANGVSRVSQQAESRIFPLRHPTISPLYYPTPLKMEVTQNKILLTYSIYKDILEWWG